MNLSRLTASLGLAFTCLLFADEKADFFEARIRPVLATHCFECHGIKDKGGLKLDSREAALKGGDSGAVIVLGKPKKSLLIQAVEHLDEDLAMPPKKKLSLYCLSALDTLLVKMHGR